MILHRNAKVTYSKSIYCFCPENDIVSC